MKCRKCKKEIPDESVFCMWCGEKQTKTNRTETRVPTPRQLNSGTWFAQMTVNGERVSVSAPSESEWYVKARAIKSGLVEASKAPVRKTVQKLMDEYIEERTPVLSPNTIRGYISCSQNRFRSIANKQADRITDWQRVVNVESKLCSPKTLQNAWRFLSSALDQADIHPDVVLPSVPVNDCPWLTAEQITVFLQAIKGTDCELAALLALHSLRRGEIFGLMWDDITDRTIHVHRTLVQTPGGGTAEKQTAKTKDSERYVTIVIPRLLELTKDKQNGSVMTAHIGTITKQINRVCEESGLPLVGLHGLRRSYASLNHRLGISELETMRQGGWSDYQTVHKHYIKLDAIEAKTATDKIADFYSSLNY